MLSMIVALGDCGRDCKRCIELRQQEAKVVWRGAVIDGMRREAAWR